jgi:tetratricopeptide (TPR) repeat protein
MVLHVPIRKWSRQASLQNGTWLIPILGIILVLYPSWNIGTASSAFPTVQLASTSLDNSAHVDGIPAPALYKEYSKKYFQNRSIRFAEDMTVRESYLAGLTHSIIKEIKARKKEKSLFPSDVLNHTWANLPPLTPFDSNLAEFKSANGTASLNKVYPAWEKSQFSEYFRAYLRVEEIRSQLINSATSGQKLRMFREEYRSGLEAYSHEQYQDAVLWFDGLLESYGYRTVDDVLFYRSEALMELEYLYQALAGYREIIEKFSQSPFWEDAIVRAFDILDQLNAVDQIKQLYQELEPELAKISPATQDIIDLKMCWISFADGDYDRTVIHANSISNLSNKSSTPKRLGQISASIALASAWAMKGDYSKAIPILQDVISQASRHSGISKEVERDLRDDARVRLGSIRFKMGEFKLSLEQLSQVVPTSRDYTLALLGMAWDHYYLKDFQKTIITTQELLTTYPGDAIGYEAKCLQTCSLPIPKSVDSTESAMADRNSGLQSIIDDAVRNWKLEEASLERERLLDGIQEVAGWEEAVFMDTAEQPSGAPAAERFDEVGSNNQASKPSDTSQARLFERYLRVRSYLTTLYKRLCILELYDASPLIQPVIREEAELARVANELNDVGASRLDGTERWHSRRECYMIESNLA